MKDLNRRVRQHNWKGFENFELIERMEIVSELKKLTFKKLSIVMEGVANEDRIKILGTISAIVGI